MNYNIELSDNFKKEAKRLSKKYKSLKSDLNQLFDELAINPTKGISLGNDIYKVRLSTQSKGKGKSGGARVMTFIQVTENTVTLFSIYNKGKKDTISDKEIKQLIKDL